MKTISDIQFDTNYSHATSRFLLLNDQNLNQNGASPVIELPHALLMSFIHVFCDLFQCRDSIKNDRRKMITLTISNEQIIDWNNQINDIDPNVNKIYIFCYTYLDYLRMKTWNGCYQNKIQDVYLPNQFDYNLIRLGIDHVRTVMEEFRQERALFRKFCNDANRLVGALQDYFQYQMDSLDDVSSEENQ